MKFVDRFLTRTEQKAILAICGLALLGFILGQFDGFHNLLATKTATPETTEELVESSQRR